MSTIKPYPHTGPQVVFVATEGGRDPLEIPAHNSDHAWALYCVYRPYSDRRKVSIRLRGARELSEE
jgi:hypothetical protein